MITDDANTGVNTVGADLEMKMTRHIVEEIGWDVAVVLASASQILGIFFNSI